MAAPHTRPPAKMTNALPGAHQTVATHRGSGGGRAHPLGAARTPQVRRTTFCAPLKAPVHVEADAQIGGYLKPSLCTSRLTRTSAALTCN